MALRRHRQDNQYARCGEAPLDAFSSCGNELRPDRRTFEPRDFAAPDGAEKFNSWHRPRLAEIMTPLGAARVLTFPNLRIFLFSPASSPTACRLHLNF